MNKDLFIPIVAEDKLSKNFCQIQKNIGDEPGRLMLNEIFSEYPDIDGTL